MYDVIVSGSGVFPAICAIRLARLLGPDRIMLATRDRELAGDCPELLIADLVDPAPLAFIENYLVMEWDRFAVIDADDIRYEERRVCLVDPVQVYADFVEHCAGMKVLTGLAMMRTMDSYLIADGNVHDCVAHAAIPDTILAARQQNILAASDAAALDCPLLADFSGTKAVQVIPIGGGQVMVNTLLVEPVRESGGQIDLAATFPLHAALNSLLC